MARSNDTVLIASGASGGHLFPAIAVAQELVQGRGKRGPMQVVLVLGGSKFSDIVKATGLPFVRLPAAAFNDRGPVRLAIAAVKLMNGLVKAYRLVAKAKPVAVFGTGGYATVALMLAAKVRGVPTIIHEQNVLPGRANKFLAKFVDVVVLTFEESKEFLPSSCGKVVVAGTPLREEILAAAKKKRKKGKDFTMLVLGGSQGARILSEVVPEMLATMKASERKGVRIIQQGRGEDLERVVEKYEGLGLAEAVVQPFFKDLPAYYAQADVVIGRSGVGTVLECATFGVPAIYVPLELADGHQKLNAGVAEQAGAAVVVEQAYFTPANLLVHVRALMNDPQRLEAMQEAARTLARPGATQDVARVIESVIGKKAK
jgi:UDP-N-acetylglucosamine--N-acetylmuramyl-(pentapeptide) pyrophosphoryl-undecaprenol N-acetylglucosamine transferase